MRRSWKIAGATVVSVPLLWLASANSDAEPTTPKPSRVLMCAGQPLPAGWVAIGIQRSDVCRGFSGDMSDDRQVLIEQLPASKTPAWGYSMLEYTSSTGIVRLLRTNTDELQICQLNTRESPPTITCSQSASLATAAKPSPK